MASGNSQNAVRVFTNSTAIQGGAFHAHPVVEHSQPMEVVEEKDSPSTTDTSKNNILFQRTSSGPFLSNNQYSNSRTNYGPFLSKSSSHEQSQANKTSLSRTSSGPFLSTDIKQEKPAQSSVKTKSVKKSSNCSSTIDRTNEAPIFSALTSRITYSLPIAPVKPITYIIIQNLKGSATAIIDNDQDTEFIKGKPALVRINIDSNISYQGRPHQRDSNPETPRLLDTITVYDYARIFINGEPLPAQTWPLKNISAELVMKHPEHLP